MKKYRPIKSMFINYENFLLRTDHKDGDLYTISEFNKNDNAIFNNLRNNKSIILGIDRMQEIKAGKSHYPKWV